MSINKSHSEQDMISHAEIREIAREVAKEEGILSNKFMRSEIKDIMREVIKEELGSNYESEREFIKNWMKRTDQFSNGFWGKIGQASIFLILSILGAIALSKFGFVTVAK